MNTPNISDIAVCFNIYIIKMNAAVILSKIVRLASGKNC